ncbi:MAG: DUF4339 domain-containing protein, partial [Muribaculaceae bacterium]|nr:DUF4339 domain-containing protein [Muribaculaceae bacterium]
NAMGPFTIQQIQILISQGGFTPQTMVWKEGMAQWEQASNIPELLQLFNISRSSTPSGMPPVPPTP